MTASSASSVGRERVSSAGSLRIAMLLPTLDVGGMEQVSITLASGLHERGHRVSALCLHGEGALAQVLRERGVPVAQLPLAGLRANFDPRQLARWLRDERVDVSHSHSGVWLKSAAGAVFARVPATIHTEHGLYEPERGRERAFMRAGALLTDATVAVSPALRQHLVDKVHIPAGKVVVIDNGVDCTRFAPRPRTRVLRGPLGLANDVPLIGIVARLSPVKDHATLLESMRVLGRTHPEAHLAMIGDGDLREALTRQANDMGLADRVHFTGVASDTAVAYSDLDVLTLSSLSEGTSISLLEGMASGVAIVATAVGGTVRLIGNDERGLLVPPAAPEALASALGRCLTDTDLRERLANAALGWVREQHSTESMCRAYEKLYRSVIQRKL